MRKRYDSESNSPYDFSLEDNSSTKRRRNSVHSVPLYSGALIVLYLLCLFGLAHYLNGRLPTALDIKDEATYPDAFISERAIHDLRLLTKIGPRVTGGYENEILAVDYITREISFIIQQAHPNQKIETDLQVVSGAYTLSLLHVNQISVYANIQNIIVKIHGRNDSRHSLLVNAHFDSVPTSPGGSDDGINIVAMLEILRKLSKSSERFQHNIVLLFNGAEETPLQASHGFITKHKWAKECKVVLNLEACGAGGKIILFQTGPQTPWLMKYYKEVPHPYAQAAGEEIFQTGWIPSDTDFRIFRDFGDTVGMDMAFYVNGYRYHTKYDDFENIPHGSYQHVGDNLLHLVRALGNAPELSEEVPTEGKMVYFDIFGWFMVCYTTAIARVINLTAVVASVAVFIYGLAKLGVTKATLRYAACTCGALCSGWLLSVVIMFITAWLLDGAGRPMTWYANPLLLFGLYVAPALAACGAPLLLADYENVSLSVRCQMQAHFIRIIWTLVLIIGTIFNVRSMYALITPVLFNALGFAVIYSLKWQYTVRKWQLVYLASLAVPTLCLMYQALITFLMFIPIMGRIGSNRNPEIIIGVMTILFTILIASPYIALMNLLKNMKYFLLGLLCVFVLCVVIAFTPLGFMYKGSVESPAPQRYWIMHTVRKFHNSSGDVEKTDSGFFLLNMDRNSPSAVAPYVQEVAEAKPLKDLGDCDKYILCGLPLSHAKMVQIMEYSTWIPAGRPIIHEPLKFKVNSKENVYSTVVRYNVTVSGPDRVGVYLLPKHNTSLLRMSLLDSETALPGFLYKNRVLYFILFTAGRDPAPLTFTFDVLSSLKDEPTIDIVVTAKYVHDKKIVRTPQYSKFLAQFPDWADVTAWLGDYSAYVI